MQAQQSELLGVGGCTLCSPTSTLSHAICRVFDGWAGMVYHAPTIGLGCFLVAPGWGYTKKE